MTPTARQLLDAAMPEAEYQEQIIQWAEACGWWAYHVHDSRRSNAGFLDLFLLRPPELFLWEVKAEKGRVRPEQQMVIDALRQVKRVRAGIVRPSDWPWVEAELMRNPVVAARSKGEDS